MIVDEKLELTTNTRAKTSNGILIEEMTYITPVVGCPNIVVYTRNMTGADNTPVLSIFVAKLTENGCFEELVAISKVELPNGVTDLAEQIRHTANLDWLRDLGGLVAAELDNILPISNPLITGDLPPAYFNSFVTDPRKAVKESFWCDLYPPMVEPTTI